MGRAERSWGGAGALGVAALAWAMAGCTSDDTVTPPPVDASVPQPGHDASASADGAVDAPIADASRDAHDATTLDAGSDAPADAGADTNVDTGVDSGVDTGTDAGADTGLDAGTDTGVDAGTDTGVDSGACLSPTAVGGAIYYGRVPASGAPDGTTWLLSAAGDAAVFAGGHPVASHDGKYLVLRRGGWPDSAQDSVVLRTLASGDEVTLYTPPLPDNYTLSVAFTNDGLHALFDWHAIVSETLDGLTGSTFSNYDGYDDAPSVAPGSGAVAVENTNVGIIVMDSAGGSRLALAGTQHGDRWPSWSPDGAWIAFMRYGSGTIAQVFKVKPDGTGLTQLAAAPAGGDAGTDGFTGLAQWSTDGAWVIAAGSLGGASGLFAVPASGAGDVAPVCGVTAGAAVDSVGGVVSAPTGDAGAASTSGWGYVRVDDCSGTDVAPTTPSATPDVTRCTAATKGLAAICWDGVHYANGGTTPFCTYKSVTTSTCTGGANPGYAYICEP